MNKKKNQKKRTIYLKGLSFKSTKENILNHFNDCGLITSIAYNNRGYACITFATPDGAKESLKLNSSNLDGHNIHVEYTNRQPQDQFRETNYDNYRPRGNIRRARGAYRHRDNYEKRKVYL